MESAGLNLRQHLFDIRCRMGVTAGAINHPHLRLDFGGSRRGLHTRSPQGLPRPLEDGLTLRSGRSPDPFELFFGEENLESLRHGIRMA